MFDSVKSIFYVLCVLVLSTLPVWAVDMQAHMGTDEAQNAYSAYLNKQSAYYTDTYSPDALRALVGNDLFGALNALMGSTCRLASGFDYGTLRDAYVDVDKDLNINGNIIGYYDGASFSGIWDSGTTWNREHTWPQSCFKGSNKKGTSIPMGYDMQSVRPALISQNSSRGNTPYGESGSYYDPDEIKISNSLYSASNLGTYRGDCARVIIYDYVVYGKWGTYSNSLYRSEAKTDLQAQVGKASCSVFESIPVLLKWHMSDPISLTEMVRNDGAQDYQGNRNPFIDYPELAIQMLKDANGVTTYPVTVTGVSMWPAYQLTLSSGFVAYLGTPNNRPASSDIVITGATYTYDESNGRLTIKKVSEAMTITGPYSATSNEQIQSAQSPAKFIRNGQILILNQGRTYNLLGQPIE